ncbi:hypothetical protein E2C01_070817 [Portunus trituberculatus]|uniref:Uncharacterized protein n=1 Tax=Portunus trituberculatus TaxID=210409 RepID=A0A5B7I4L8_PORTR|nr:hypothetical protein [Portunus trituberculatus]
MTKTPEATGSFLCHHFPVLDIFLLPGLTEGSCSLRCTFQVNDASVNGSSLADVTPGHPSSSSSMHAGVKLTAQAVHRTSGSWNNY